MPRVSVWWNKREWAKQMWYNSCEMREDGKAADDIWNSIVTQLEKLDEGRVRPGRESKDMIEVKFFITL